MQNQNIHILTALSYSFEENSYIIYANKSDPCVIIDPGIDTDHLLSSLHENQLSPQVILITHGHFDHIAGIPAVQSIWPDCKVWTSEGEAEKLINPVLNLSSGFGFPRTVSAADRILKDQEEFSIGELRFQALHIPGHSNGHLVYILKNQHPLHVFVGDTVFQGSIGRSDFPDGNSSELIEMIHSKILTLPDDTLLYPGHGSPTTVKREKEMNPFLQ